MSMRKNEAKWVESRQRWQINVQSDGERRTFTSSKKFSNPNNIKGKIEAEKKADKWLDDKLVDENCRINILLDKYYDNLKLSTSKSHYKQYEQYIRCYAKPTIGSKRISKLTKADLQKVINTAYSKRHLSEKTLKNVRGFLMNFIKYCRDIKATSLFVEGLTIPKGAKKANKEILLPEELTILFTKSTTTWRGNVVEDFYIYAYRFAVLTGIRPGELFALENRNITNEYVSIEHSINIYGELTNGKNDNAQRTFSLNEMTKHVLSEQREMMKKAGFTSKYVFPNKNSGYIGEQNFLKAWKRYCAGNGITHALTPYEMRHTFVSINTEMPESLKKMVVGHSKNMDTEGTYGHQKKGDLEKAAEYSANAFKEILQNN